MKKNNKVIWLVLFASIVSGVVSAVLVSEANRGKTENVVYMQAPQQAPVRYATFNESGEPNDFSVAAENSVNSVVHVKVAYKAQRYYSNDIFDYFFGNPGARGGMQPPQEFTPRSSGSGVIISKDGYIVTNNHVIDKGEEVTVTLNDKTTMTAKVVGKDPTTDIAVIKIDGNNLPALNFANSDDLKIGQWVLAVGNPFDLTSTVTAGIVSAKTRSLGIISTNLGIESFIQTDAAVNPGNSGGALVNLKGELVGINTAIASHSGQFEGYSFAVPSNIAKKVVEDLVKHGVVQRAFLGISYVDLNDDKNIMAVETLKKEIKNFDELKKLKGVYVADVVANSSAEEAGIKKGDIITEINGKAVKNTSVVSEEVGKLRPGDKLSLTIIHESKTKQITTVLRNKAGNTDVVKENNPMALGAEFKTVDEKLAEKLQINGGAQIVKLSEGKLKQNGVKQGFIITKINQRSITNENDLKQIMTAISGGGIFIEGIYPDGKEAYYAFSAK